MTICFKHMEYLHFFIDSCVPSLFYTVRIVLVMQSPNQIMYSSYSSMLVSKQLFGRKKLSFKMCS